MLKFYTSMGTNISVQWSTPPSLFINIEEKMGCANVYSKTFESSLYYVNTI